MTDGVKVETVVRADPHTAFRVFTDEVDAWWNKRAGEGPMRFDAGRLLEGAFEVGRVLS